MLIPDTSYKNGRVEFVSYTGKWPNLCRGILTLRIEGETYKFGHGSKSFNFATGKFTDGNYDSFWDSGGRARFSGTTEYPWQIYQRKLPEHLKQYAAEIDKVFNENVRFGCCGGCL